MMIVQNSHLLFVFINFCIFSLACPKRVCASVTSVSRLSSSLSWSHPSTVTSPAVWSHRRFHAPCRPDDPLHLPRSPATGPASSCTPTHQRCLPRLQTAAPGCSLSSSCWRSLAHSSLNWSPFALPTSTLRGYDNAYLALVRFDLLQNTRRTHEVRHSLQLLRSQPPLILTAKLLLIKERRDFNSLYTVNTPKLSYCINVGIFGRVLFNKKDSLFYISNILSQLLNVLR